MAWKVTKKNLDTLAGILNTQLDRPKEMHNTDSAGNAERDKEGRIIENANHYYVGGAYGGYRLEQICSDGHGSRDVSPRLSKRALADWIHAYLDGVEDYKRNLNAPLTDFL